MAYIPHVVTDIETLGTKPGSVIASIGAVKFNPRAGVQTVEELMKNSFKTVIDIKESIADNFLVSGSTIEWWLEQSKEAQEATFGKSQKKVVPFNGLMEFKKFYEGAGFIWSNGANFDVPLIEAYMDRFNISYPWQYSKVRCYRTLARVCKYDKSLAKNTLAHDCLADSIYQAQVLQAIVMANPQIDIDG